MKVQPHSREQGGFNYVTAIILLILAVIAVFCIFVAPKYYMNFSLRQELWALMVRSDELSDRVIVDKLVEAAADRQIPLTASQIQCARIDRKITCHYEYEWPTGIPGLNWSLKVSETKEREISKVKLL